MIRKALLLSLLMAAPSLLHAALPNMFGIGSRSMSMGMVSITDKSTPFQAYSHPASLGFIDRFQAEIGVLSTDVQLDDFPDGLVVDNQGFATSGVLGGNGQTVGLAIPIGTKATHLTFAIAAYVPWDGISRVTGNPTNFPYYPMFQDITRNTYYTIAAGMRIWRGFSFGVGISSSLKTVAKYQFGQAASGNISASAAEVRSKAAPIVSGLYRFSIPLIVGLQYRHRTFMETQINAELDTTIAGKFTGTLTSFPFYSPTEVMLSVAGKPFARWYASADVLWVNWSDYPLPFSTGNIQDFTVGNNQRTAGFTDEFVYRLGLQRSFVSETWFQNVQLRGGYQYHPSPVPDQTGDTNFADSNRHSLTFGVGSERPIFGSQYLNLQAFFQWHKLVTRSFTKAPSSNIGAPGYQLGGHILVYGLGASLKF